MTRGVSILVWGSVAAALSGFFLPWVRIDLSRAPGTRPLAQAASAKRLLGDFGQGVGRVTISVKRGSQEIAGDLDSLAQLPPNITGAQIPGLAKQQNAQLAIALMELVSQQRQALDRRCQAVYLVPGLAVLAGIVLTCCAGRRVLAGVIGIGCAVLVAAAAWKLALLRTHPLVGMVSVGPGLWLSIGAYGVLALASGFSALSGRARA